MVDNGYYFISAGLIITGATLTYHVISSKLDKIYKELENLNKNLQNNQNLKKDLETISTTSQIPKKDSM
jgi:hypothetical protein